MPSYREVLSSPSNDLDACLPAGMTIFVYNGMGLTATMIIIDGKVIDSVGIHELSQ